MPNGAVGDDPLTDVVVHGLEVFTPDLDSIVRELNELGSFRNAIAFQWLMEVNSLLVISRQQGRAPFGIHSMDEEQTLDFIRGVLTRKLSRARQEHEPTS